MHNCMMLLTINMINTSLHLRSTFQYWVYIYSYILSYVLNCCLKLLLLWFWWQLQMNLLCDCYDNSNALVTYLWCLAATNHTDIDWYQSIAKSLLYQCLVASYTSCLIIHNDSKINQHASLMASDHMDP